ncbi:hypothetical protein K402DRAFT_337438 [Aulographum hederae CBS 113979]|uniref:Uncharacterized protein n=1 Tax=Aulographum hederae CBS 113979 TaxID=1176131 RepID=A0A6G1GSP3_9PEZI|nr:hypothetical protein K402DRAFT_337438 [Aulographum hederae CBS 113979]
MTSSRNQQAQRLAEIIREHQLLPVRRLTPLPAPNLLASNPDVIAARELLRQRKVQSPNWKDPSTRYGRHFRSRETNAKKESPETWKYTSDEASSVLSMVVDTTDSCRVIEHLLDLGADTNFVIQKEHLKTKKTPTSRGDFLKRAVTAGNKDTVCLLAQRGADQESLDSALVQSLAQPHSLELTKLLLMYGADAGQCGHLFIRAVSAGNVDLVELCLRASKPISQHDISAALPMAIVTGAENMASLLLAQGADPNWRNAQALQKALAIEHFGFATTLVSADIRPSQSSLDAGLKRGLQLPTINRFRYVELLLCAGASASIKEASEALVTSTQALDSKFIKLLVSHGVSPDYESAEALRHAVKAMCLDLVKILLCGNVSEPSLSSAVDLVPDRANKNDRYQAISMLVERGAKGPPLARSLIKSVKAGHKELTSLLIGNGATADDHNAESVRQALQKRDLETLKELLTRVYSATSLGRMLSEAWSLPKIQRREAIGMLLQAGVSDREKNHVLLLAVADDTDTKDLDLVNLLLRHRASVDYKDGYQNCIKLAAAQDDFPLVKALCSATPPPSTSTLSDAILPAFHARSTRNGVYTYQIMKVILEKGATGDPLSQVLLKAMVDEPQSMDLFSLLLDHGANRKADPTSVNRVFPLALREEHFDLERVRLLLQCFRSQSALDTALYHEFQSERQRTEVVKLLLDVGASVNSHQGSSLKQAVKSRKFHFVREMIQCKPNIATLTSAFDAAVDLRNYSERLEAYRILLGAGMMGNTVHQALVREIEPATRNDLRIVEILLDRNASPVIILAMRKHPNASGLVGELLKNGYLADGNITACVDDDVGKERLTSLVWALSGRNIRIGNDVIISLLEAGANVNFITPMSKTTPLMLASANGRSEIIPELLKRGSNLAVIDHKDRTALFRASATGYSEIVKMLVTAGAHPDDGSLHEASRNLSTKTVSYLIEQGHQPDFRSLMYGGRSALGELCLNASTAGNNWTTRLRQTMALLVKAGSDLSLEVRGKSVLYLGLDHDNSYEVTKALLETKGDWTLMNSDSKLFKDGDHRLSPTKYVESYFQGPPDRRRLLINLLEAKGITTRFFAVSGAQPPGACGLPEALAQKERMLRERAELDALEEKDHQTKLRHMSELAQHGDDLASRSHQGALVRMQQTEHQEQLNMSSRHRLQLGHERSSHGQTLQLRQISHTTDLQHRRERDAEDLRALTSRHALQLKYEGDRGRQTQMFAESERLVALEHRGKKLEIEGVAEERRMQRARVMGKEEEERGKRQFDRTMRVLDRQKEISAGQRQMLLEDSPS